MDIVTAAEREGVGGGPGVQRVQVACLLTSVIETLRRMINRSNDSTTGSRGTQVKECGGSIGYWVFGGVQIMEVEL